MFRNCSQILCGLTLALAVVPISQVHAQAYPTKPIRLLVPLAAGSAAGPSPLLPQLPTMDASGIKASGATVD